jgi:hypothetical protein
LVFTNRRSSPAPTSLGGAKVVTLASDLAKLNAYVDASDTCTDRVSTHMGLSEAAF